MILSNFTGVKANGKELNFYITESSKIEEKSFDLYIQSNLDIPDTKNLYGQDKKKLGIKRIPVPYTSP